MSITSASSSCQDTRLPGTPSYSLGEQRCQQVLELEEKLQEYRWTQSHYNPSSASVCRHPSPSYLDSPLVLGKCLQGHPATFSRSTRPHIDQVIIATTSQMSSIWGPAQPTHFLAMATQCGHMVICYPNIMVMDMTRAGTTGERRTNLVYRVMPSSSQAVMRKEGKYPKAYLVLA